MALAACGYSGTLAQQVRSWASQNTYVTNRNQVLADAHSLELAVAKGTAKELRTVCGGLSSDAGTLYSTLVTPDRQLTRDLNHSMEDFFGAAERCAVASSTKSAGATRALAETRSGLRELAAADLIMRRLGVLRN